MARLLALGQNFKETYDPYINTYCKNLTQIPTPMSTVHLICLSSSSRWPLRSKPRPLSPGCCVSPGLSVRLPCVFFRKSVPTEQPEEA